MSNIREQAAVLALISVTQDEWHWTASMIEEVGSASRFLRCEWSGFESFDTTHAERIAAQVTSGMVDEYAEMIVRLRDEGVQTLTILDEGYPHNLRDVYNRPPMLFIKGGLVDQDQRAVAVVGTRTPSHEGEREASYLAAELARREVTVLSGLARGIDTVAHDAVLKAGGRTVAVMGTGINRIYPPENVGLAERILERGALVSQFWPNAPPTRWSFPMRNAVMSGMAVGTVVVEAGPTSGAKMQARLALEHGKRLFLVESLVTKQEWARRYRRHPGAVVVHGADEITAHIDALTKPASQLSLM